MSKIQHYQDKLRESSKDKTYYSCVECWGVVDKKGWTCLDCTIRIIHEQYSKTLRDKQTMEKS